MICCTICNYLFHPEASHDEDRLSSCAVCRIRTTSAARHDFLRGRRIAYAYMDSD
ncbi:MAG: hypothetical protein ACYDCQ_17340 [Dehalococcoidia bacterium]